MIVAKKRALRFGKGHAYKTKESIKCERDLKYEAWVQWRSKGGGEAWNKPVRVVALFRKEGRRGRADVIGLCETVLDALIGVVYTDDHWAHDVRCLWSKDLVSPTTVVVSIEPI